MICGAAVRTAFPASDLRRRSCIGVLAFAEEVSVYVICGAATILAFAEVSPRAICVAATILVFAEEVSMSTKWPYQNVK